MDVWNSQMWSTLVPSRFGSSNSPLPSGAPSPTAMSKPLPDVVVGGSLDLVDPLSGVVELVSLEYQVAVSLQESVVTI